MASRGEPNWTAFYEKLRIVGPSMLRHVPKALAEWVVITAQETDQYFSLSLQEQFYCDWQESTPEHAVLEALDTWADNVCVETAYAVDFVEQSEPKRERLRESVEKIVLKPRAKLVTELIMAASQPEENRESEEAPTAAEIPAAASLEVETLPFQLLPPGSWTIDDVVAHYERELASRGRTSEGGPRIDPERLRQIKSLLPARCYVGSAGWTGYVVFEFPGTDKVVLECPIEGNATYILPSGWEAAVSRSKQKIRQAFAGRYAKVVHKGDWLERIRRALWA